MGVKQTKQPDNGLNCYEGYREIWHPKQSLGEWLEERFKKTGWTPYELTKSTDNMRHVESALVSPATVYRMSKSKDFFIATPDVRENIAWKKTEETIYKFLGYYGYPPTKSESDPKNPFAIDEQDKLAWMSEHYWDALKYCDRVTNTHCYLCSMSCYDYDEANSLSNYDLDELLPDIDELYKARSSTFTKDKDFEYLWDLNEYELQQDLLGLELRGEEFFRIFLSSHKTKQFGAIRGTLEKHFEAEIHLCLSCAKRYERVLLLPVADLVEEITEVHRLDQRAIAYEIGLNRSQPLISKIKRGQSEFIAPLTVKKLIGLRIIGTLSDESSIFVGDDSAYSNFYNELDNKGYSAKNYSYRISEVIKTPRDLRPVGLQHANSDGEYELSASCDLLVTSDNALVKLACYFFPKLNQRTISLLTTSATCLEATHICFIDYPGSFCLNICSGIPDITDIPPNHALKIEASENTNSFDQETVRDTLHLSVLKHIRALNNERHRVSRLFEINRPEVYEFIKESYAVTPETPEASSITYLWNILDFEEFQKSVVNYIESEKFIIDSVAAKYGMSKEVVKKWLIKWAEDKND